MNLPSVFSMPVMSTSQWMSMPSADKNDPVVQPFQLHKFSAGNHELCTVYGQLHGNCTGGQNDESGSQLLIEDSNRTSVGEARPALYKIDTSFFKTVDCFIRYAFPISQP
ncbi:MAG: hypothetical protein KFF68_06095 [Desulfosarcina sp.]|nr:hypothetical protein [Desulfosarcina sp.]